MDGLDLILFGGGGGSLGVPGRLGGFDFLLGGLPREGGEGGFGFGCHGWDGGLGADCVEWVSELW